MANNVEMIPKAIDDYNEAAERLYEKKGTGRASTSVVQQPLKLPMPPSYMQLMNVDQPRNDEKSSMPPFFEFTSYVFDPLSLLVTGGMVASGLMYLANQKRSLVNYMRDEGFDPGLRGEDAMGRREMLRLKYNIRSEEDADVFRERVAARSPSPDGYLFTPLAKAFLYDYHAPFGSGVRQRQLTEELDRIVLGIEERPITAYEIMSRASKIETFEDLAKSPNPSDIRSLHGSYLLSSAMGNEEIGNRLEGGFDPSFRPMEDPYGDGLT